MWCLGVHVGGIKSDMKMAYDNVPKLDETKNKKYIFTDASKEDIVKEF